MICINLSCDEDNCLSSVSAEGHAQYAPKGHDIVCAGVTILLRTVASVLSSKKTIHIRSDCSTRGFLCISVVEYTAENRDVLRFATYFLKAGLSSLEAEFPNEVKMQIDMVKD